MTRMPWTWLFGVSALAVPLAIVSLPAAQLPDPLTVEPPTSQTLVCPSGSAKASVYAAGEASISGGPVSAKPTLLSAPVVLADQTTATVLRSEKRFVAGTYTADGATLGWAGCASPRTSTIVQIVRPKISDVLVTNADDVEASVDLTLLGPSGEIVAVGASGVVVSPHSSRLVPISALVADDTPIGVAVQTTSGRVSAVGRTWSTSVADFSVGAVASRNLLIPGLPSNAKQASLVVTNPGTVRATVSVSALSKQTFALANGQNIVIEPRSTVTLDVAKAIGTDPVALRVTADQPVLGSAVTGLDGDIAVAPSVDPIIVGGLMAPGGGTLSVSNPADTPVTVTLTIKPSGSTQPATTEITLAAGQTWTSVAPVAPAVAYELLASTPVVAAVTTAGASGVFVAPFASVAAATAASVALDYDIALR